MSISIALCVGLGSIVEAVSSFRGRSTLSTGRQQDVSAVKSSTVSGSRSRLKIIFAFIAERRATCATGTPAAVVCKQIDRVSSSVQSRFFRRAILCPKLSASASG